MVLQWLQQYGNPYTAVAFDSDNRAAIEWGVYGAPETFLIDGAGRVVFKFITPMTQDVWEREFQPRAKSLYAAEQCNQRLDEIHAGTPETYGGAFQCLDDDGERSPE